MGLLGTGVAIGLPKKLNTKVYVLLVMGSNGDQIKAVMLAHSLKLKILL